MMLEERANMRRKEREVKDFEEMVDIIKRADTICLGINGDSTYVVPVSFGMEVRDGKVVLYFHSAKSGQKIEYLHMQPEVCVEAHIFLGVEPTEHGITTRYESVIGFGNAVELTGDDKLKGLRLICEHYGYEEYPLERCKGLAAASVFMVELEKMTGKHNISQNQNLRFPAQR